MSDTYQPVYDAVRSKISGGNVSDAISNVCREVFDISRLISSAGGYMDILAYEWNRPSVLYRPKLSQDGNAWIALYGDNIAVGVVGVGDSPAEAMSAFDVAWNAKIAPPQGGKAAEVGGK